MSGLSGAHLKGWIRGRRPRLIHVTVPGAHRRHDLAVDGSALTPDDTDIYDGIRVTGWPRTVVDATAQGADPRRLLVAVEKQEGVLDVGALLREIDRAPRRPGAGMVRQAIRAHHPLAARCRSDEEVIFLYAVLAAGLPTPEVNNLASDFEVDFCWRRARVIAEVDGRQHALVHQRGVDDIRDHAHEENGLLVLRFPAWLVRTDVGGTVRETARVLRERGCLS